MAAISPAPITPSDGGTFALDGAENFRLALIVARELEHDAHRAGIISTSAPPIAMAICGKTSRSVLSMLV